MSEDLDKGRLDITTARQEARVVRDNVQSTWASVVDTLRKAGQEEEAQVIANLTEGEKIALSSATINMTKEGSPELYTGHLALAEQLNRIDGALGSEKGKLLIGEYQHELEVVGKRNQEMRVTTRPLELAGTAIENLKARPTWKGIKSRTWGDLFGYHDAMCNLVNLVSTRENSQK